MKKFKKFIVSIVTFATILTNMVSPVSATTANNTQGQNKSVTDGIAGETYTATFNYDTIHSMDGILSIEDPNGIVESYKITEVNFPAADTAEASKNGLRMTMSSSVGALTGTVVVTVVTKEDVTGTATVSFERYLTHADYAYDDDPITDTFTVTVAPKPIDAPKNVTISSSAAGQIKCDQTVTLTGSAEGEEPITYAWYVDGSQVATGATWVPSHDYSGKLVTLKATNAGGTTEASSYAFTVVHNWNETVWEKDSGSHWHECDNGHILTDSYGSHTDAADSNGLCDVCGYTMNDSVPTVSLNVAYNNADLANKSATITANATGYGTLTVEWKVNGNTESTTGAEFTLTDLVCEDNNVLKVTLTVTSSNGQSVTESLVLTGIGHNADTDGLLWAEEDGHYKDYDCGHKYDKEPHTGKENGKIFHDDDSHYQECECGYKIDDVACGDADDIWNTSNTEHWHECECGNIIDKAQHADANYDGKCDTCEHAVDVEAPSIKTQPKDVTKNFGEDATFSVVAQGKGTLTYTWYVKEPTDTDFRSIATGSTLSIDDVTCEMNGFQFKVVVSNVDNDTVESNVVTLTVNGHDKDTDGVYSSDANGHWITYDCGHEGNYDPHVDSGRISGTVKNDGICDICGYDQLPILLTITTQPTAQTVNHGESVTFTVEAQGDGVTYQWYADDQPIAGATSATYTHNAECTENGTMIKVVVTETTGNPNETKTSTAVKLTVNETYASDWSYDENHHWHASNCGNAEHVKDKAAHKDSNEDGTCDVCSKTGLPLNLKITKQPVKQSVNAGETATFSVEVKGNEPFTYQWYVGGQAVAGATSAEFTYTAKCTDNNAEVYVTISDADNDGSISSNPVKLTVKEVYDTVWSSDDTHHWHAGTCGNPDHFIDKEAHKDVDNDGACDICQSLYPHTRVNVVEFDKDAALDDSHPFNNYISDDMKSEGLDTVEKVFTELLEKLQAKKKNATTENTAIVEAELQYFDETTGTWIEADETHWPASGTLTVTLPYPEGTNAKNFKFYVMHMFTVTTSEHTAGDVEVLAVKEKADGLQVTVKGLSPFIIYYEKETSGGSGSIVIPDTAVKGIDYSALISALEAAGKLDGEGAEWMYLMEAMNRAMNMLDSDNQFAVDKAAAELNNAIDSLIVVQGNPVQGSGLNTGLAVAGVAAIAVLALILALNKKRKYNDNTPVVEYDITDDNN